MGYTLQKFLLTFVNIFYMIIGSCLMAIALNCYYSPKIHITKIAIGMIFVGFCLLSLSILGIYGAIKQHQAALFFYSLFMIIIFISQYALAIYALGLAHRNLVPIIKKTWASFDDETKIYVMNYYKCCPLDKHDYNMNIRNKESLYKDFAKAVYCQDYNPRADGHELNCGIKIEEKIDSVTTTVGNVALGFCFVQIFGVWLAMNFRNAKGPGLEGLGRHNYGHGPSSTGRRRSSDL